MMDYTDSEKIKIDSDGKMYVDGVEVRVKSVVFEDKKSMTAAYKDLKNSFDFGVVSAEEFCQELEMLRDTYLEAGSAAWWSYTKQIIAQEQKMAQEQEKIIDSRIDRISYMYEQNMISAEEYYSLLKEVRDRFIAEDSEKWAEVTMNMADIYSRLSEEAKKAAENMAEGFMGPLMQEVTVKDKKGNVTDHFFRLTSPDADKAEEFAENYSTLKNSGASSYLLDRILSMSAEEAAAYVGEVLSLGDGMPGYFKNFENARQKVYGASSEVFGVAELENMVRGVMEELAKSGFFSDITINQNFNGARMSPADVSMETVNALKIQGVGI